MSASDHKTRRLLLIGFGALLLLLAFTGVAGVSVIRNIQKQSDRIREDYVKRDQILEQLRSEIYLSGTYVRDLLLEQDPSRADVHRQELAAARQVIDTDVAVYQRILRGEERAPFQRFKTELDAYFASLQPAMQWNPEQRRQYGYAFMKNSLLPRRMVIVQLADQIANVSEREMEVGDEQTANLFARFRRMLVLFIVLALVCGALVAFTSMRSILHLEQTSGARLREAENARKALQDLSARLLEVQESERRALSRELHDEVGQALSAVLLGIGNVAALVHDSNNEARAQLNEVRDLAETTVATVRDMSLLLRPSMLDDLGLIPAVQWQAREVSRNHDVFVQVHADAVPEDLLDEHKTCIYRIVQEALRNAIRHSDAKQVQIDLSHVDGNGGEAKLLLTIQDNGRGFSPEREKGLGLLGMEERVTHLHGHFRISSNAGHGTSIYVELPLVQRDAEVEV